MTPTSNVVVYASGANSFTGKLPSIEELFASISKSDYTMSSETGDLKSGDTSSNDGATSIAGPSEVATTSSAKNQTSVNGANADLEEPAVDGCPVCMDTYTDPRQLHCGHTFCKACIEGVITMSKSHMCPTCRFPFRTAEGKQPDGGSMTSAICDASLPGYEGYGCIVIHYNIPSGIQGVSGF